MGADLSALVLAPEAPYPLVGGGALRTGSLLHYLARTHQVDLIVFRQPGAPDPAGLLPPGLARDVMVLSLPPNRRGSAARAWRNGHRLLRRVPPLVDRFSGFGPALRDALAGRRYDIGIVEHFWCAPYAAELEPHCRRLVLDLHNIESELHARCAAAERGPARFAHRVFERASLRLERAWLPRFSQLLVTSDHDAALARPLARGVPVTVYPNAIPATPPPPRLDEEALVFSGNLEYHPNISAVRYFRQEIWPLLRERSPRLVWRLVGKNPAAVARYTAGDPRIQVTGAVPDAVAELARCRVVVVPLLAGSGTRFKILEAWAAGVPVVSTTLGAEGLPVRHGEHLLLADSPAAFADAATRLLDSATLRKELGIAGRRLLEQRFTWDAAWNLLDF